jgi:hypothetical protein
MLVSRPHRGVCGIRAVAEAFECPSLHLDARRAGGRFGDGRATDPARRPIGNHHPPRRSVRADTREWCGRASARRDFCGPAPFVTGRSAYWKDLGRRRALSRGRRACADRLPATRPGRADPGSRRSVCVACASVARRDRGTAKPLAGGACRGRLPPVALGRVADRSPCAPRNWRDSATARSRIGGRHGCADGPVAPSPGASFSGSGGTVAEATCTHHTTFSTRCGSSSKAPQDSEGRSRPPCAATRIRRTSSATSGSSLAAHPKRTCSEMRC